MRNTNSSSSMTSVGGKIWVGIGAAMIALGAVSLSRDSGSPGVFWILLGISGILTGLSLNAGGKRRKVMRGLSLGVLGVAVVFFVIWIMQPWP